MTKGVYDRDEFEAKYGPMAKHFSDVENERAEAGWTDKFGAAVDRTQAGLYGIGEAVGQATGWKGLEDPMAESRRQNEYEADNTTSVANRNLGIPNSYKDISGAGSLAKYAGSLAVDSAPQLAATAVASRFGLAPMLATSYGFALSDTLENQREQAGKTDLLTGGLTAVPYAGVDAFTGVGGDVNRIARTAGRRVAGQAAEEGVGLGSRATRYLDDIEGIKGRAARGGVYAGKEFLEEGAGETFQEVMNQAARMGVDQRANLTSDDALERYGESFVGGGLLGAGFSARHLGGRSAGYEKGSGRTDTPLGDSATTATQASANQGTGSSDLVGPPPPLTGPPKPDFVGPIMPEMPLHGPAPGLVGPPRADPSQMPMQGPPRELVGPQQVDPSLGPNVRQAVQAGAPGGLMGPPRPPTPAQQAAQQSQAATQANIDRHAQNVQALEQRAIDYGIPKPNDRTLELLGKLETALDKGHIDKNAFEINVGHLKAGKASAVNKFLGFLDKAQPQGKQSEPTPPAPAASPAATAPTAGPVAAPPAAGLTLPERAPGAQLPKAPKPQAIQPAPKPVVAKAPVAAKAPTKAKAPAKPKPKAPAVAKTASEAVDTYVKTKRPKTALTPEARQRIYLAAGLDKDGNYISTPLTYEEVAAGESTRTGKEVTKKAIQNTLVKYGFTKDALVQLNKLASSRVDTEGKTADMTEEGDLAADEEVGAKERGAHLKADDESIVHESEGGEDTLEDPDADVDEAEEEDADVDETERTDEKGRKAKESSSYGSGFSTVTTFRESKDRNKETVLNRFRRQLKELAEHADLDPEQQAAFAPLAKEHAAPDEKQTKEQNKAAQERLLEDVIEVMGDKDVFPEGPPSWLLESFEHGKTTAAALRKRAVKEMVQESDAGPAPDIANNNAMIEALNDPKRAAAIRATLPAEQQALMDLFLAENQKEDVPVEGNALTDLLPAEFHNDIEGAEEDWAEDLVEGDPQWDDLATDLQAQWVRASAAHYGTPKPGQIKLSAQRYNALSQELKDAQKKLDRRSDARRNQDTGATTARTGEKVPEDRGQDQAGETAGERPVAVADEAGTGGPAQLAPREEQGAGEGAQGREDTEHVAPEVIARAYLRDNSSVESDDIAGDPVQLADGTYVSVEDAAQAVIMGLEPNEQSDPATYAKLGIPQEHEMDVFAAVEAWYDEMKEPGMRRLRAGPPAIGVRTGPAAPSVKRELRKGLTAVERDKMTPEQLAEHLQGVQDAADMARVSAPVNPRVRGADFIREKLLEAKRRGWLSPEAVDFAEWLIRQNEGMVSRLGVSMRTPNEDQQNTAGFYTAANRVITLMKGDDHSDTIVHEILHHLERLMPRAMQAAIQRQWARGLVNSYKRAMKNGTPAEKLFFGHLMNYHFSDGGRGAQLKAEQLLVSGQVPYGNYQYFNSSEFWAVNGARLLQNRFGANNIWRRIANWTRETLQYLKGMLGLRSDAPILRALNDQLRLGDDTQVLSPQLAAHVATHRMLAGPRAATEEQRQALRDADWMERMEHERKDDDLSDEEAFDLNERIRAATGWFRGKYDNKWRYEFSDSRASMKMNPRQMDRHVVTRQTLTTKQNRDVAAGGIAPTTERGVYKLDEIIDHPELFKRYPAARDIEVVRDDVGTSLGWFNEEKNRIGIKGDHTNAISTLIHEVQHWVQAQEGFARGGHKSMVYKAMNVKQRERFRAAAVAEMKEGLNDHLEASHLVENIMRWGRIRELVQRVHDRDAASDALDDAEGTPEEKQRAEEMLDASASVRNIKEYLAEELGFRAWSDIPYEQRRLLDKFVDIGDHDAMLAKEARIVTDREERLHGLYAVENVTSFEDMQKAFEAFAPKALRQAYLNVAGEAEARDTQARLNLTEEQRKKEVPYSSQDIERRDAVRTGGLIPKGEGGGIPGVTGDVQEEGMTRRQALFGALAAAAGMKATAANADPLIKGRAQPISARAFGGRISPAAEKLLRGGDLRGAVRQIADEAKDPRIAKLAAAIYVKLGEGNTGIAPLKTRVDDKTVNENHAEAGINKAGEPTATFYTAKGARGLTTDTVLHEALHVTTLKAYYKAMQASKQGDEKAMRAMMEFQALHSEFIDAAEAKGYGKGLDATTRDSIAYAIGNREEFFVRSLTDPAFQKFLASMPYKGETLWDHFKYWVSKLLDGAGIEPSWLDAATLGSQRYFDAQGQGMADWHRGRKARTADSHASAKPAGTRREMILNALLGLSIGGTGVGLVGKIAYDKITGKPVEGASEKSAGPVKDETTLGRATPVSAATLKARISPAAEKLLRNGRPDNTTDTNGAEALRRAIDQIAKDHPELAALAAKVKAVIPDRLLVKVDGLSSPNAHGKVTLKGVPQLTLYTYGGREGLTAATILHETLHAAVAARYHSLNTSIPRSNDKKLGVEAPKAADAMAQFHKVFQEFERQMEGFKTNDEKLDLSISEALGDPDEFFVRALTDPVFQAHLATMKYEGTTLLQRFKDWVKRTLFGVTGQQASWLDAALIASGELAESSRQDAPDWKRYQAIQNMSSSAANKQEAMNSLMERAVREETAGVYVPRDKTTVGRARPVAVEALQKRMSPEAEALLRAGFVDGATNPAAVSAIKAAVRQIAKDSPELAGLAQRVLDLMPRVGVGLSVDGTRLAGQHGNVMFTGGKPTMNLFTAEGRTGLTPGTFLHEALHAAIGARYYMLRYGMDMKNYGKVGVEAPKAAAEIQGFEKVWREFGDHVRAFVNERGGLTGLDPELRSTLNESVTNPDEFFVRAITDPVLQEWMASRKYEGKSLLEHFKDWVAKTFFNVTTGERPSWLDAALEATTSLSEAAKQDKPDWGYYKALRGKGKLSSVTTQVNATIAGAPMAYLNDVRAPVSQRIDAFNDKAKAQTERISNPTAKRLTKLSYAMLGGGIKTVERTLSFTVDIARRMHELAPSIADYVNIMQAAAVQRQRRETLLADQRDRFAELSKGERAKVNALLYDSTMSEKWAYQPGHLKDAIADANRRRSDRAAARPTKAGVPRKFKLIDVKPDPALSNRYNELTKEAQAMFREVLETNYRDLLAMQDAAKRSVGRRHDHLIEAARASGNAQELTDALEEKDKAMKGSDTLLRTGEFKPYAPLKRFGNFVVLGKSQAYLDAEAAHRDDPTKETAKELGKLERDHSHFYIGMRETRAEANVHADEIAGKYQHTQASEKDETYNAVGSRAMLAGFTRMERIADARSSKLDQRDQNVMNRLLTDLHYSMLAEASARQSERQRKGVAGADPDMFRSHLTKGKATAHFISTLESGGEAQDALTRARREVKMSNSGEMQDNYNEILRRHAMNNDWRPTPFWDRALAATSYWTLLSSPAAWFVNATQPFVVSTPVIGGKHGIVRAAGAMTTAYQEMGLQIAKLGIKGAKMTEEQILAVVPKDMRDNMRELINRGAVSGDSNYDLHQYDSEREKGVIGKINDRIGGAMGQVEILNRLTTAVAAMRLEVERGNAKGAVDYAQKIIYETHGDYSGFNAPAFMRHPVGRVLFQFRKFQLIQMGMYGRLLKQAFNSADPTERAIARRSLMYSFGTLLSLTGTLGLPGAQVVGFMLGAAFGDDDEPDNMELTMRKLIGDGPTADLLLKGIPAWAGIDMSGRIGAGTLGNPLPFGKMALDRKSTQENLAAALGPFVGTVMNMMDGAHKMMSGDIVKGFEQMAPKGAANAVKGLRLATQGMTQPNGDVVMKPEDIGVFDGAMQAFGLPTSKITDRSMRSTAKYDTDTFFKDRNTAIKREYSDAYRSGDRAEMAKQREEWTNMQAHMKADGKTPSPLADLIKAPLERAKREKMVRGGIEYKKKDAGTAQMLESLY